MAVAEDYARALRQLLPPSRYWRDLSSGVIEEILLACADELVRLDGRAANLLAESDPRLASELLSDFEAELGIVASGTDDQRRAHVVALLVRRQRFRPIDFKNVLAPILGLAPIDVAVIERTHAEALAMGDAREIFRFFIVRDPILAGTYDLAAAQALVNEMKPSHTLGFVIESAGFICDDPHSLCDRDVLAI